MLSQTTQNILNTEGFCTRKCRESHLCNNSCNVFVFFLIFASFQMNISKVVTDTSDQYEVERIFGPADDVHLVPGSWRLLV